jgi:hypothetical protein
VPVKNGNNGNAGERVINLINGNVGERKNNGSTKNLKTNLMNLLEKLFLKLLYKLLKF